MEFIVSLRTIKPSLLNNYKKVEMRVEFVCVLELTENTFKYFFLKKKNRWTWKSSNESVSFTNAFLDLSNSPNFRVCRWNPMVWPLKWNLVSRPFASHKWFLRILYKEVWNFWEFCPLVTIRSERDNKKLTPFQWNHLICYPFKSYFWGVDYS